VSSASYPQWDGKQLAIKGQWQCRLTGKVTVGRASHWSWVRCCLVCLLVGVYMLPSVVYDILLLFLRTHTIQCNTCTYNLHSQSLGPNLRHGQSLAERWCSGTTKGRQKLNNLYIICLKSVDSLFYNASCCWLSAINAAFCCHIVLHDSGNVSDWQVLVVVFEIFCPVNTPPAAE